MSKLEIFFLAIILIFKLDFISIFDNDTKNLLDLKNVLTECVYETYGIATKDYSFPGNGAKNLFETKFDQVISTGTKDYSVSSNGTKNYLLTQYIKSIFYSVTNNLQLKLVLV